MALHRLDEDKLRGPRGGLGGNFSPNAAVPAQPISPQSVGGDEGLDEQSQAEEQLAAATVPAAALEFDVSGQDTDLASILGAEGGVGEALSQRAINLNFQKEGNKSRVAAIADFMQRMFGGMSTADALKARQQGTFPTPEGFSGDPSAAPAPAVNPEATGQGATVGPADVGTQVSAGVADGSIPVPGQPQPIPRKPNPLDEDARFSGF